MIYNNFAGKTVDTDKEIILCPWCHKEISKEDIDNGNVYHDGTDNPETSENWMELIHNDCAEEASEWRRGKYGY